MKKFLSLLLFFIYSICNAAESPITIVIPFAVGGSSDSVARIIQQGLSREMGRSVQILNKPGAGGAIAVNYVIEQKSNGTVLLLHSNGFFINHVLNSSDKISNNFVLLSLCGYYPYVLVTKQNFAYQNLSDWKKLKDKSFSIGNGGPGTSSSIVNRTLENYFPNIDFVDVGYSKGFAPLGVDIVAGVLDMSILPANMARQMIGTGKVHPIAVAGPTRLKFIPNVPTFQELNMPKVNMTNQSFLIGSSSLSNTEIFRIRAAMKRVLDDPEIQEIYKANSLEFDNSVINFDTFMDVEQEKYSKLLKNIK